MNFIFRFIHGLRGKLIFTYTVVTVLALLALEVLILIFSFSRYGKTNKSEYLSDVIYTLYPQAHQFLQPGQEDLPGLQSWLEQVMESGYASLEPQDIFDSPAAKITPGSTMYVLSMEKVVLAQTPRDDNDMVGEVFTPPIGYDDAQALENALNGWYAPSHLSVLTPGGKTWMAVPIPKQNRFGELVGVIIVTIEPAPVTHSQIFPTLVGSVAITALVLLCAVAPFGAIFGLIMSRGLTRRLSALTASADAWAEGDFRAMPADRKQDEIGLLSQRMRNMAERTQVLLQDRRVLAQMEERNRLARDLHDTVKQQSFATMMQVRAARNQLADDPAVAEKHLLEAESLIKASQQELALMIAELRPAALENQGLETALRAYLENWSGPACIPASFNCIECRSLPLDVEQVLYRVAQEALANVARHSRASAVRVRLLFDGDLVRLEIQDNGIGFDLQNSKAGYGMQSMRERLMSVNGQLHIFSSNEGTVVTAEIRLRKE